MLHFQASSPTALLGDCENLPLSMHGTRHSPAQTLLENDQDQTLVGSFIGTDVPPTPVQAQPAKPSTQLGPLS